MAEDGKRWEELRWTFLEEDEIEDRGGLGEGGVGSPSRRVVADFFSMQKNTFF